MVVVQLPSTEETEEVIRDAGPEGSTILPSRSRASRGAIEEGYCDGGGGGKEGHRGVRREGVSLERVDRRGGRADGNVLVCVHGARR